EPDQLRRANALQGIVNRASMTLGAALAGVLVATVGPRWTYAVDAATFAVSIATLLVVRLPRLAGGARGVGLPGAARDARDGLRLKPRREGVTAMHGVALFAPVCACLSVPVPLWLFLICQAVAWAGIAVFLAIWFASLQRQFARTVHGRVLALEGLVTIALQPVGLALAPLAAERFGSPAVGL